MGLWMAGLAKDEEFCLIFQENDCRKEEGDISLAVALKDREELERKEKSNGHKLRLQFRERTKMIQFENLYSHYLSKNF